MAQGVDKWSTTAASNATADATINWAEGQSPSSVNDSARAMMARIAEWKTYTSGGANLGGSANTYTFSTGDAGNTSLVDGYKVTFACNATNTGASTLNVDSLGAKPLRQFTGVALSAGALVLRSVYSATYDSATEEWMLHGSNVGTGDIATANIAADAVTYAKMQNVSATSRVLGRKTASAGDVEECTLSEVLDFIGSAARGDILVRGASTWARLPKGTSAQVLTMGADDPTWATPASTGAALASFSAHKNGSDQSVPASTATKLTFGTEVYDVGTAFSSSRWTPPAGKVQITAQAQITFANTSRYFILSIYKNGSELKSMPTRWAFADICALNIQIQDTANGTDYYEVYAFHDDTASLSVEGDSQRTFFMGTMI
jgi:hypothetical protein